MGIHSQLGRRDGFSQGSKRIDARRKRGRPTTARKTNPQLAPRLWLAEASNGFLYNLLDRPSNCSCEEDVSSENANKPAIGRSASKLSTAMRWAELALRNTCGAEMLGDHPGLLPTTRPRLLEFSRRLFGGSEEICAASPMAGGRARIRWPEGRASKILLRR